MCISGFVLNERAAHSSSRQVIPKIIQIFTLNCISAGLFRKGEHTQNFVAFAWIALDCGILFNFRLSEMLPYYDFNGRKQEDRTQIIESSVCSSGPRNFPRPQYLRPYGTLGAIH